VKKKKKREPFGISDIALGFSIITALVITVPKIIAFFS